MSYLIVVAHPDDEVLGAGATMYKLSQAGYEVNVCIMSAQAMARAKRPADNELKADTDSCMEMLGVKRTFLGDFPNIMLNTVPHLELVQFIEKAIEETEADVIITHHPEDLNNDHLHTSLACQEASRLFQRKNLRTPLKELLFMEVPSATEWALNTAMNIFRPDTFVEVGKKSVIRKIEALSQYRNVMRPYPHPRSEEGIMGLAAYRGGQSGCDYAEAFQTAMRRIITF
ncbi:MAG: PIG-L family deacetylase [Acetatifactor sp.]|nr:PIG-L family deacetylase [Acetatifactor sp.]